VARQLRELGERGLPRGPRQKTRANPAGLTVRELEVLELLIWRMVGPRERWRSDVGGGIAGAFSGRHERKVQSARRLGQTDIRGLGYLKTRYSSRLAV